MDVKLSFNLEKSLQVVLYIANRIKRRDFHKIFKLIYFADRNHLSDYGRSITGDTYIAMTDGPVPSKIYDIFKALRGDGLFADKGADFSSYFVVTNWSLIEPVGKENLSLLSESDIEKLDESIALYGSLSWDEIREKSHDFAWRNTAKDCPISLENILLENGEEDNYIAFVKEMAVLNHISL